jgi:hypothetical protein
MSIILNSQQAMTAPVQQPVRQPIRNGLRSVQQQPSNMNISEFIATDLRARVQSGDGLPESLTLPGLLKLCKQPGCRKIMLRDQPLSGFQPPRSHPAFKRPYRSVRESQDAVLPVPAIAGCCVARPCYRRMLCCPSLLSQDAVLPVPALEPFTVERSRETTLASSEDGAPDAPVDAQNSASCGPINVVKCDPLIVFAKADVGGCSKV